MDAQNALKLRDMAAAVAEAVTNKAKHSAEAGQDSTSAIARVRDLATEAAKIGAPVDWTRKLLSSTLTLVKVNENTIKPYASALSGYMEVLADGGSIKTGHGPKGTSAMTAPKAREYFARKYETAEEKAEREAAEERAGIVGEIVDRLKAVKDAAFLRQVLETLPEVEEAPALTAEQQRLRDAEREVRELLESAEAVPVQPVQVAAAA